MLSPSFPLPTSPASRACPGIRSLWLGRILSPQNAATVNPVAPRLASPLAASFALLALLAVSPGCDDIVTGPLPSDSYDASVDVSGDHVVNDVASSTDADARDETASDTSTDSSASEDVAMIDTSLDSAADSAFEASLPDAPSDGPSTKTASILSLNLHCLRTDGTSFASNKERLAAIAKAAIAQGVEAIAVQEACENAQDNAIEMLRDALSSASGANWQQAWAYAHLGWEGTPNEAKEGVGILANGPISHVTTLDYFQQGPLRRVAISGQVGTAIGPVRLMSVHLDFNEDSARLAQARHSAAFALASADPSLDLLIAGDFNAKVGDPAHQAPLAFGFRDLTASLDSQRIDHIMAHRGAAFVVDSARSIFDGTDYPVVSDHHGVLVRLRAAPAPKVTRTRLKTAANAGNGKFLSVRGNAAPLTWSLGWPATATSNGGWTLVLTEIADQASFEYKWLLDDKTYQTGVNLIGTGGAEQTATPSF